MLDRGVAQHTNAMFRSVIRVGAYPAGVIDVEELYKIECHSLPGSGTCSAMFTACTMVRVTYRPFTVPHGEKHRLCALDRRYAEAA